jgi:WD40 repeat protein
MRCKDSVSHQASADSYHTYAFLCSMLQATYRFREHSSSVYALCQGALPHELISGASDGFAVQWNFRDKKQDPLVIRTEQAIWSNCYVHELGVLVLAVYNGDIHVIDVSSKKETHLLRLHSGGVSEMHYNTATQELYAAGADGVLSVWNTKSWSLLRAIPLSTARLRTLAHNPSKQWLAVGGQAGLIHVLETKFFNEIFTIQAHLEGVSALAWHPSKPALMSGGKDALLKAWNADDGFSCVASLEAHNYAIYGIAFSPNKLVMATCSRDKTIKLWDAKSLEPLQKLEAKHGGHSHSVNRILWNETGLYSCSDDRAIVHWAEQ